MIKIVQLKWDFWGDYIENISKIEDSVIVLESISYEPIKNKLYLCFTDKT